MPLNPYKHKLGEFKPEHFDGDPIEQEVTPAHRKASDDILKRLSKRLGLPENAIERQKREGGK